MDLGIYINGQRLELFPGDRIEINNSVKTISDISKVFADFSQAISVPASNINNPIFEYWYDSDIDGTINWNLRPDAYIEIQTLPYRYGCVQLDRVKEQNGKPYAYEFTFYSKVVNLSDLYGDDELNVLDFPDLDHEYTKDNVVDAMHLPIIGNGDLYYPLINAVGEMSIGAGRNLISSGNNINYTEFKPAIREIKIIEAIETKYNIKFSRDFFGRALFYNKFLWLHRNVGKLKAFGNKDVLDLTSAGTIATAGGTVNLTTNTISYNSSGSAFDSTKILELTIIPSAGFSNIEYQVFFERNGVEIQQNQGIGTQPFTFIGTGTNAVRMKITAAATFDFTFKIRLYYTDFSTLPRTKVIGTSTNAEQTVLSYLVVNEQMPVFKIKDYINSLIAEFNLVIRPTGYNSFYIDTLDSYYAKGKVYDITDYVNIKEIVKTSADVKKRIDFLYQKCGSILGLKYFNTFKTGYGDLTATYDVQGSELSIKSEFENMLFERLPNEITNELTDIQAGFSIDENLQPYIGKPISFYKNGYTDSDDTIYIQPSKTLTRIYHTATEDNVELSQVTNSLNFGAENSSYFYQPINLSLYFNFWKTFIEDLFNRKTRVLNFKARLPFSILYDLQLNDKFVISKRKYKISNTKINLTDAVS